MLAEWYFCCCINANPSHTDVFLHLWETIHDPDSDWPTLSRALGELRKTEVWMRLYLLPEVLAILHRENLPPNIELAIETYCADLVEFLPDKVQKPVSAAFNSAYFGGKGNITQRLEACVGALSIRGDQMVSATPYLDLKEFISETTLLAIVLDLLKQPDSSSEISALVNRSVALKAVLTNGLDHRCGRMAFRLAAVISQLSSAYPLNYLRTKWRNRFCTSELEPDVMQTIALVTFDVITKADETAGSVVLQLMEESILLTQLDGFTSRSRDRDSKRAVVLSQFGFDTSDIGQSLSIIFWQATLWLLASDIDPETTAGLKKYWGVPTHDSTLNITVAGPLTPDQRSQWKMNLEVLGRLRRMNKQLTVYGKKRIEVPEHSRWVFFSPWIQINYVAVRSRADDKPTKNKSSNEEPEYHVNYVALIRLLVAALVSFRVSKAVIDDERRSAFNSILVHASSVLSIYWNWLRNYASAKASEIPQQFRLTLPLSGLALFTRSQIELAGKGAVDRISPSVFLALLTKKPSADASNDERTFLRSILPEVLMSWISNAYAGAGDQSGPGRWLQHISEVNNYYSRGLHDDDDRVKAALVMRFLGNTKDGVPNEFDWRRQGVLPRDLKPRLFLLAPKLSAKEWATRVRDGQVVVRSWEGLKGERKLYSEIERIAALGSDQESAEYRDKWRQAWLDSMNGIAEKKKLTRFARLRLIELLDCYELSAWPRGQEAILLVLMEFGVHFELKRVFNSFFFDPQNESEIRTELKQPLIKAIYQKLQISSAMREERVDAFHPRYLDYETRLIEYLEDTLTRLAYMSRLPGNADGNLRNLLNALETDQLTSMAHQDFREVRAFVEQHRNHNVVRVTDDVVVRPWTIRGMAFDPNRSELTISIADLDTSKVIDVFSMPDEEYRDFQGGITNEVKPVLGLLVSREGENDGYNYEFNCGLSEYVTARWEGEPVLEPSRCYRLPLYREPGGSKKWRLDEDKREGIKELRPRLAEGDVTTLEISERRHGAFRTIELFHDGAAGKAATLDEWDPNLALAKYQLSAQSTPARIGENGIFHPFDSGLRSLVLKGFNFLNSTVEVLTLIGRHFNPNSPERIWRFSTKPGENYLLKASDFTVSAAAQIEETISREVNPGGLLVAVKNLMDEEDKVRLELATEPIGDPELLALYPQFSVPFDYRNLKWRNGFKEERPRIAIKESTGWMVAIDEPVPGFDSRAEVQWIGGDPPDGFDRVDFELQSWDPRIGKASGNYGELKSLDIEEGDYRAFLDRWLHLEKGSIIKLKAAGQLKDSGRVMCWTPEGMAVYVDAESLTMKALPSATSHKAPVLFKSGRETNEVIPRGSSRSAAVLEAPNWRPLRHFDPNVHSKNINNPNPQVVRNNACDGIVIDVPKKSGNKFYNVLWSVDRSAIPASIEMDLPHSVSVQKGSRLTGTSNGPGWRWQLRTLDVHCRALWSVTDARPGQEMTYLGPVAYDGRWVDIAEIAPGRLAVLPESMLSVPHLAIGNGTSFREGLHSEETTTNRYSGHYSWRGQTRAVLLLRNGRVLTGDIAEGYADRQLSIENVELHLDQFAGDDFFLQRFFYVSARGKRGAAVASGNEKDSDHWRKRLLEYLDYSVEREERRLRAVIRGNSVSIQESEDIRVPATDNWSGSWTQIVEIRPEEGPYVPRANYLDDARVALYEERETDAIYGSFRRVPPKTPEAYMAGVGAAFNVFVRLKEPLYYVGREKVDPLNDEQYEETHHRFEWGAGKMLVAPESALRFEGQAFGTSQALLNPFDQITGVTFEHGDFHGCLININRFHLNTATIIPSEASQLFTQRKKHQIVHILHLLVYVADTPENSRVEVEYVEAFNERVQESSWAYEEVIAKLNPNDHPRILERARKQRTETIDGPVEMKVFGRFNESIFKESWGTEVVFDHVRLSFQPSADGGSPLQSSGERIFLRARRIIEMTNETALELTWQGSDSDDDKRSNRSSVVGRRIIDLPGSPHEKPDPLIDPADVGPDFERSVRVLRRSFSARENLLPRIANFKNQDLLTKNTLLMVLVSLNDQNQRVECNLKKGAPPRGLEVLGATIGAEGFLAAVSEADTDSIIVEVKVGVFVKIPRNRIENQLPFLRHGAIVHLKRHGEDFEVDLAAYDNTRYVTTSERLCVALPMNPLFKIAEWRDKHLDSNDEYWNREAKFAIGGLPSLTPLPGKFDEQTGTWRKAEAKDCMALMSEPHPLKIVSLIRDNRTIRFSVATDSPLAGCLAKGQDRFDVRFGSLRDDKANQPSLLWPLLSFADQSIDEIIDRINEEKWTYHDKVTATLVSRDGSAEIDEKEVGNQFCLTGPLFFESSPYGDLRLRYTPANFFRFGFPVDELISSLLNKPNRAATYPVAGVPAEGGLWIELAPGRICEIPPNLVMGEGRSGEFPLNLNWESFAPGDQVTLALPSGNPLLADRIVLREWEPGSRGAFGSDGCFLPVANRDSNSGAVTLGAGDFTVVIPAAHPDEIPEVVTFYPDNEMQDGHAYLPKLDDVVLLGLNELGELAVLGLPNLVPEPDRHMELWQDDVLAQDFLVKAEGKSTINRTGMIALITAVGGALPVTVEFISKSRRSGESVLFFSRRLQRAALARLSNCITFGRVIGPHPRRGIVLLRCGGDVLRLSINQVIGGLPESESVLLETIRVLKGSQTLIYLHDERGQIRRGLPGNGEDEPFVTAVEPVTANNGAENGLICRAADQMGLHWLAGENAAWASLCHDELRAIFQSPEHDYFRVRMLEDQSVSVIDTNAAAQEFKSYRIGKKLVVKLGGNLPADTKEALGEAFNSRVTLRVEDLGPEDLGRETSTMEISSVTRNPQRVVVVPLRKRKHTLDLPGWMIALLSPGKTVKQREQIKSYLIWREHPNEVSIDPSSIKEATFSQLNEWLVKSYYADSAAIDNNFRRLVAETWKDRNEYLPQIDLVLGIITILLFEKLSGPSQMPTLRLRAAELAQNLGARALRSVHVEVLYRKWLRNEENRRPNQPELWQRLREIALGIDDPSKRKSTLENIDDIAQLGVAVALRQTSTRDWHALREIQQLSWSLSSSIGDFSRDLMTRPLEDGAFVTRKLFELYKALPLTLHRESLCLTQAQLAVLEEILDDINREALDLILMDNFVIPLAKQG